MPLSLAVDGSGHFNVTGRDLEYEFWHYINAAANLDAWVPFELFQLDGDGNRQHGGTSITLPYSVWEVAIWDPGSSAFVGGTHGYQIYTSATLLADGVPVSLAAVSNTTDVDTVQFEHVSDLYRIADNVKFATVTTTWTWFDHDMQQATTINWLVDHNPGTAYVGMLPVVRTIGTEQITSVAEFNWGDTVVDVSEAGHVGAIRALPPWEVQIYDDAAGVDFLVTYSVTGTTPQSIFVSNAAGYNKVYCDYATAPVLAGAVWDSLTRVRWMARYPRKKIS